ncbi:MAG: serine/threonine protein kinase [Planctomycetes bacterium]|nr:serine/threonine protein kinase [Planctomycetota bacterium]
MSPQQTLDFQTDLRLLPDLAAAVADLRRRWGLDQGLAVERYLEAHPEFADEPNAIELVLAEIFCRMERADAPQLDEYRRRFPKLAEILAERWPATGQTIDAPAARDTKTTATFDPKAKDEFSFLTPSDQPGMLGQFGSFQIVEVLGRGGMGCVFRAYDPQLLRHIALKVMHEQIGSTQNGRDRFLREARAAAGLQHDHVVPVYQVGEHNSVPFIVLPLLQGETLDSRLKRQPVLPVGELVQLAKEAAAGLAAAHAAGFVHRDIKPSNIWLETADPSDKSGRFRVKILDFGLARTVDDNDRVTVTGMHPGTPPYMSPEQIEGKELDGRTDLFSLGAVLYEAATGHQAFSGPTMSKVLLQVTTHEPPDPTTLNPALPAAFAKLILQLLRKESSQRPATARQIVDQLTSGAETGTTIKPDQAIASVNRSLPSTWKYVAAFAVLLVAVLGIWRPWNKQPTASVPVSSPSLPEAVIEGPLRVLSFDVHHFAKISATEAEPRGILGRQSFVATRGDQLTLTAKLSRPGYSFIIAFRPDGVADLCYPNDEDTPPPLSDRPSYPDETARDRRYGLAEGGGLWIFTLVTSEHPLPSYRDLLTGKLPKWTIPDAKPGQVWSDDGQWLETMTADKVDRGSRGKDEKALGPPAAVTELTDWLKKRSASTSVRALGFGVKP